MVKSTITLILLATYICIIFFFPTPADMISGTFVLGIVILPLAAIFYVWFISIVSISFWKMYEYMMDVTDDANDHINSEIIILLKKVPKYIYVIVIGVLFYYFYFPNEVVSIEEEGVSEAYISNYDRSKDYKKEYNDRIRF